MNEHMTNELKKQARAAEQAAKTKTGKPKKQLVKYQTGLYTYKYVTPKQAAYWGRMRSAYKTKLYRDIRKKKNAAVEDNRKEIKALKERIKKDKRALEKIEDRLNGWVIEWEDLPDELKEDEWRGKDSDAWLIQRLFIDNDDITVTGNNEGSIDVVKLFMRATTDDYSDDKDRRSDIEALMIIFEQFPNKAASFFGTTAKGTTAEITRKLEYWSGLKDERKAADAVRRGFAPVEDPFEQEKLEARQKHLKEVIERAQARVDALDVNNKQIRKVATNMKKKKLTYGKADAKIKEIKGGAIYSFAPGKFDMF